MLSNHKKDPASELPSTGPKGIMPPVTPAQESIDLGLLLARVAYVVRYKTARGVETSWVTGSTPEIGRKVAEQWVNSQPGRKVLSVVPAFVADERILGKLKDESNPETAELSRQ